MRESSPALARSATPAAWMGTSLGSWWRSRVPHSLFPKSSPQRRAEQPVPGPEGGGSGPLHPLPLQAEGASIERQQSAWKVDSCSLHRGRTRKKVSTSSLVAWLAFPHSVYLLTPTTRTLYPNTLTLYPFPRTTRSWDPTTLHTCLKH